MENKQLPGTAAALFSVAVWSSTYISTKILVGTYTPLQISFVRFTIGLLLLMIAAPPRFKRIHALQELKTAAAGILGIFLYYFLENLATKHTYASNVSVIVTSIPLITGIIGPFFFKEEKFKARYAFAFLLTIAGFLLILSQSGAAAGISAYGDILALSAAVVFALYTLVLRSLGNSGSPVILTRKIIFYGWICITAAVLQNGRITEIAAVFRTVHLKHFLFLGVFASGICFTTWAVAVKNLGAVRSSQFIYLVPFITVSLSILVLHEKLTVPRAIGMFFIVSAVILSQTDMLRNGLQWKRRKDRQTEKVDG